MVSNRGVSTVVITMIVTLIVLGLTVGVYILWLSKYLDIHEMVREAGVERHTLNLGQVLLSSDKLAYQDDIFTHRGIFVREKIVSQLQGGSELTEEVGYPNSIIVIGVEDFETNEKWDVTTYGSFSVEGLKLSDLITCLVSKLRIDFSMIFRRGPGAPFWETYDVRSCLRAEMSDYGSAVRSFPIAIKDGDDIHSGRLVVTVNEWW